MKQFSFVIIVVLCAAILAAHAADAPATQPKERTTESGLKIVEVQPSGQPVTAQSGDQVWVHYSGRLESGKVFDASLSHADRKPISFTLGQGNVIKGWDEGLVGMKVGDKRQLIIPPALAYGSQGAGNDIPPNATLIFDVELVGLVHEAK